MTLIKDSRHLHYWIDEGRLYESYSTIRGPRFRFVCFTDEEDTDNCSDEVIERIIKSKDFDNFKLVHDFMYPEEPLKKWINKDNYNNNYLTDWNCLIEVIEAIIMVLGIELSIDVFDTRENFDTCVDIIKRHNVNEE